MVRITAVSPRGIARTYDVPGSIAGLAKSIVGSARGVLEVATSQQARSSVHVSEIVMLQILDIDRPVVDAEPFTGRDLGRQSRR